MPAQPTKANIAAIRTETPVIKSFKLTPMDGERFPDYAPGAHIKVRVTLDGGQIEERAYSLYGENEGGAAYRIAVLKEDEGRGGSRFMHEALAEGDVLEFTGPTNDFVLDASATETILIAGGIGITPIVAMARALSAEGRAFTLHYAAKTHEDMALIEEVVRVADGRAALYFDGGDPSRGVPLDSILKAPGAGKHVYACGPGAMIDAVEETAQKQGWNAANIHFERFAAPEAAADDETFEVVVRSTGESLNVAPGTSILDALVAAGHDPLFDCGVGNCGICATKVMEHDGELQHHDNYLSPEKKASGDQMCICVSRVKGGRVVLDM